MAQSTSLPAQNIEALYPGNFHPLEPSTAGGTNKNLQESDTATCSDCMGKGHYSNFTHCEECYCDIHHACTVEFNNTTICLRCRLELHTIAHEEIPPPDKQPAKDFHTERNTQNEPEVAVCNICRKGGIYNDDFVVCLECYCEVCRGCMRGNGKHAVCELQA